jgi:hypothetical protein
MSVIGNAALARIAAEQSGGGVAVYRIADDQAVGA